MGLNFSNYVSVSGDVVTAEILGDKGVLNLITSSEKCADDTEAAKGPVLIPSQVMDALDLLRWIAGTCDGTEGALNVLVSYEKSVQPLLSKLAQARITNLSASK